MTLTKSSVILTRRRIDIEYAEICKDIIIGHAELERQRANLQDIQLNPFTATLLYRCFLSCEHNDEGDAKKSQLAYFYIQRLRKEIQALVEDTGEPRYFVVSIERMVD